MPLKISVITPALQAVEPLRRTLDSVAMQRSDDLLIEHHVIDGGSDDGTPALLGERAATDGNLIWSSERDAGIYAAMNKGILRSTGDWLLFLGAGDTLVDAETLWNIAPILRQAAPNELLVYGRVTHYPQSDAVSNASWETMRSVVRYGDSSIHHQGVLVRRAFFNEYGLFDESFRIAADQLSLRRYLRDHDPIYVDRPIANQPLDGISADTARAELFARERFRVVCLVPPRGNLLHRLLVIERRRALDLLQRHEKSPLLRFFYRFAWRLLHPCRALRGDLPESLR